MLYLRSIRFRQYKYLMMPYHPRVSRLEGNPEAIWYTHLALPLPLYSHSPNVLYVFVLDPDLRLGEQRSCFMKHGQGVVSFLKPHTTQEWSFSPLLLSDYFSDLLFEAHAIPLSHSPNLSANERPWLILLLSTQSLPST